MHLISAFATVYRCLKLMMNLIVGLGNPGNEYNFTRHNFGFLLLDFYAKVHALSWQKPKNQAIWFKDGNNIFIKPQTFYNNSGEAIAAFAQFYKIPPERVLVVCDDFDLPFGTVRFRAQGSDGGNNGLKSATTFLHTTAFPRLRLGTNNPAVRQRLGDIDFVLGHFTAEEKAALPDLLTRAMRELEQRLA